MKDKDFVWFQNRDGQNRKVTAGQWQSLFSTVPGNTLLSNDPEETQAEPTENELTLTPIQPCKKCKKK